MTLIRFSSLFQIPFSNISSLLTCRCTRKCKVSRSRKSEIILKNWNQGSFKKKKKLKTFNPCVYFNTLYISAYYSCTLNLITKEENKINTSDIYQTIKWWLVFCKLSEQCDLGKDISHTAGCWWWGLSISTIKSPQGFYFETFYENIPGNSHQNQQNGSTVELLLHLDGKQNFLFCFNVR